MNSLIHCFFLIPLFFVHAHAEVTITLPDNAEPLLLNGKNITSHQLISQNGPQQLVFNARASYREFGQQKRFVSETLIVTFSGENNHYRVSLPKINSPRSAEKFNDSPSVTVKDTQGHSVSYKIDKLHKDGIQLGRDYREEIKTYNLSQGIAAIEVNQTIHKASPNASNDKTDLATVGDSESAQQAASQPQSAARRDQINVGQMLDFWYEQADEATREAFKKRIGIIEQVQSGQ